MKNNSRKLGKSYGASAVVISLVVFIIVALALVGFDFARLYWMKSTVRHGLYQALKKAESDQQFVASLGVVTDTNADANRVLAQKSLNNLFLNSPEYKSIPNAIDLQALDASGAKLLFLPPGSGSITSTQRDVAGNVQVFANSGVANRTGTTTFRELQQQYPSEVVAQAKVKTFFFGTKDVSVRVAGYPRVVGKTSSEPVIITTCETDGSVCSGTCQRCAPSVTGADPITGCVRDTTSVGCCTPPICTSTCSDATTISRSVADVTGCNCGPATQIRCLADTNPCTAEGCENGACVSRNVPNGATCGSVVGQCLRAPICFNGVCQAAVSVGAGVACDGDGDVCTADTCNASGQCIAGTLPTCPTGKVLSRPACTCVCPTPRPTAPADGCNVVTGFVETNTWNETTCSYTKSTSKPTKPADACIAGKIVSYTYNNATCSWVAGAGVVPKPSPSPSPAPSCNSATGNITTLVYQPATCTFESVTARPPPPPGTCAGSTSITYTYQNSTCTYRPVIAACTGANQCQTNTCNLGVCGIAPKAAGLSCTLAGTAPECKSARCDGAGTCAFAANDTLTCANEAVDTNNCTQNVCSAGTCSHPLVANASTKPGCCTTPTTPEPSKVCSSGQLFGFTWDVATCQWTQNTTGVSCDKGEACRIYGCSNGACTDEPDTTSPACIPNPGCDYEAGKVNCASECQYGCYRTDDGTCDYSSPRNFANNTSCTDAVIPDGASVSCGAQSCQSGQCVFAAKPVSADCTPDSAGEGICLKGRCDANAACVEYRDATMCIRSDKCQNYGCDTVTNTCWSAMKCPALNSCSRQYCNADTGSCVTSTSNPCETGNPCVAASCSDIAQGSFDCTYNSVTTTATCNPNMTIGGATGGGGGGGGGSTTGTDSGGGGGGGGSGTNQTITLQQMQEYCDKQTRCLPSTGCKSGNTCKTPEGLDSQPDLGPQVPKVVILEDGSFKCSCECKKGPLTGPRGGCGSAGPPDRCATFVPTPLTCPERACDPSSWAECLRSVPSYCCRQLIS